jgi:hypothetical protein
MRRTPVRWPSKIIKPRPVKAGAFCFQTGCVSGAYALVPTGTGMGRLFFWSRSYGAGEDFLELRRVNRLGFDQARA